MSSERVTLDDVAFTYRDMAMRFDLAVEAGEVVAVMGPSGAGKSTLLSLIAGFEAPVSGRVSIGEEDVTTLSPDKRPVSMVFQENNLFGHLDIAANVGLGRSPSLKLSDGDRADIAAALHRVGLEGKEKRLPAQLSGGERQRAALARVLVRNRPVLLLDEPFASLGPALRQDMIALLKALHRDAGMTILIVTHHPEDAKMFSDRTAFVEDGQIVAFDKTERIFSDDAPAAIRRYLGSGP